MLKLLASIIQTSFVLHCSGQPSSGYSLLLGQYLTQTSVCYCHTWRFSNVTVFYFSLVCNTINFLVIFTWGTGNPLAILFSFVIFSSTFYIVYVQYFISQSLSYDPICTSQSLFLDSGLF